LFDVIRSDSALTPERIAALVRGFLEQALGSLRRPVAPAQPSMPRAPCDEGLAVIDLLPKPYDLPVLLGLVKRYC
jgi:hypothetical protein